MAGVFLGFVAVMALLAAGLIGRLARGRGAWGWVLGLFAWLACVGALSRSSLLDDPDRRPPGVIFLFGPILAYVIALTWNRLPLARAPTVVPIGVLVGLQAFRVPVELFLHALWKAGVVPRMLTYEGSNFDIVVGLSAPLAAMIPMRSRLGRTALVVWNVLGLVILANIVVRALLTADGPMHVLHAEVPNRMIGLFPYTYIPGFFVPLAISLHALALRALAAPPSTR